MTGLIAMFRCAEPLRRNISSTQVVFLIDIEGFDEKSRDRFNLIIKNEEIGIAGGVSCLTCAGDVGTAASDGSSL